MPRTTAALIVFAVVSSGCQPAADFPGAQADTASFRVPPPPSPGSTRADAPPVAADSSRLPARDREATETPAAIAVNPAADDTLAEAVDSIAVTPSPDCEVPAPEAAAGTRAVTVYFTCGDEERAIRRRVPETLGVLRSALEQLLLGPTGEERSAGFRSFFSSQTAGMLNSVVVASDGVARVDFEDFSRLIPNASSSAGSEQFLAQLRATIFQFPTVRAATLTFEGDCDAFWNWLQRDCERLTPR